MAISFTGQLFILFGTTQWRTQLDMHLVWHIPGSSCYKVRLLSMQYYCFSQAEIIINRTIFSRMHCALLKLYYNTICLVYQNIFLSKFSTNDSEVYFLAIMIEIVAQVVSSILLMLFSVTHQKNKSCLL